jgi:hypothetical protein
MNSLEERGIETEVGMRGREGDKSRDEGRRRTLCIRTKSPINQAR